MYTISWLFSEILLGWRLQGLTSLLVEALDPLLVELNLTAFMQIVHYLYFD